MKPVYPPENRSRGTIVALAVVPLGILAWILFWSFGVIVGVVGIAVATGAVGLYRLGSGGRIGFPGAAIASGIIVVTLSLAFVAGLIADAPQYFAAGIERGVALPTIISAAIDLYTDDILITQVIVVVMAIGGTGFAFWTAGAQRRELRNENVVLEP